MIWTGIVKCELCGHRQTSIIEIAEDQEEPIVSLECAECGNMSAHPESEVEDDE